MCCAFLHKPGKNRTLAAVKVGGGPAVVTNGAMMREEPAEMEIPLEEEEVASGIRSTRGFKSFGYSQKVFSFRKRKNNFLLQLTKTT